MSRPTVEPLAASAVQAFDYGSLELPDRTAMQLAAERIRDRLSSIHRDFLAIGAELLTIKGRVPHGTFGVWIEAELGITPRAGQHYMNAARLVQAAPEAARETVSLLPPATLYKLAAPSTPQAVVAEIIEAAEGGELPAPPVIVQRIAEATREAREVAKAQRANGGTEAEARKLVARRKADREREREKQREKAEREAAERQRAESDFKAMVAGLVSRHGDAMREVAAALDGPLSYRFAHYLRAALAEAGGDA